MAKKPVPKLVIGHFCKDVFSGKVRKMVHFEVDVTMDKKKEIRCFDENGQLITQWTASDKDAEAVWKNPNELGPIARQSFSKFIR